MASPFVNPDAITEAISLCVARLDPEEGTKLYPYDDETGRRVRAPKGNLTWGKGFNLETIGSGPLFVMMVTWIVWDLERQLLALPWYPRLPSAVKSVCLDIAYNGGLHGLLGYPEMIAALQRGDYRRAAAECTTSNPVLKARYMGLANTLMEAGQPIDATKV